MGSEYKCSECNKFQNVTKDDIDSDDLNEIASNILDIDDSGPLAYIDDSYFIVRASSTVSCKECSEDIPIVALVSAVPFFDESRENRDPRIDSFTIDVLDVLPENSEIDKSLINCICYDPIDENLDINHEDTQDTEDTRLQVIVKTEFLGGFCYLGFEFENRKIVRPIYRNDNGKCCWTKNINLEIDKIYRFKAIKVNQNTTPRLTPYPHRNEDMLVLENPNMEDDGISDNDLFRNLREIGKDSINDLFQEIKDNSWVPPETDCPSVGVLICQGRDLSILRFTSKTRVIISENGMRYNFPLKDINVPDQLLDLQTLVILGLARPWNNNGGFDSERCYILALRILQLPR